MKNVLFVINTLGRAGAETAMLELLRCIDHQSYDISLYVLTNQGDMIKDLPPYVHLLNRNYCDSSVLTASGRIRLLRQLIRKMFHQKSLLKNLGYLCNQFFRMLHEGKIRWDKLLWRVISDGSDVFSKEYDLAVAYLEGGATYYVADHVNAKHKVAFVHTDYSQAGYNRQMDKNSYAEMDHIFTVSDEVSAAFLSVYPELKEQVSVFHNIINWDRIRSNAQLEGGFTDEYPGIRLLTVCRLTEQKALDLSVKAMKILKDGGIHARWYVLGEGEERNSLVHLIHKLGLEQEFILLGCKDNPYPYFKQADIYVHASRHEGKSIAVQEAIYLGCPVILSDCSGNREQITNGVDGLMCDLTAESIADHVKMLILDESLRKRYSQASATKPTALNEGVEKLLEFCVQE